MFKKVDIKRFIGDLKAEGFENTQILDAVCDGEVLKKYNLTIENAEEIYNTLKEDI